MKIIDDATLQRLEELEKRVVTGDWEATDYVVFGEDGDEIGRFRGSAGHIPDPVDRGDVAAFVAESRNALLLLLDSVRRLKEAFDLAMDWATCDAGRMTPKYDEDMARIRELAGE